MPVPCHEIIDDIEDLISSQDITPKERYSNKKSVTVRARKKAFKKPELQYDAEYVAPRSVVPGTQTIYLKTWGCTHNGSDSEYMAGQLASYGYLLSGTLLYFYLNFVSRFTFKLCFIFSDDKFRADLWLLNSCTVKNPAEDHFRYCKFALMT